MKTLSTGVNLAAFALFPALLWAQGGPPFRSDDPDTPGNRHWEINLGFIGDRNPFGGSYSTPNIDINYGVGDRIQLKFEVPLGIEETRGSPSHVLAGPGDSLLGVKYRFYQRHSRTRVRDGEREVKFSLSTYPQLQLSPERSVARGIAEPSPQLLLPLEANAKYGWISLSGEVGYRLAGKGASNSWIQGIIAGHEFRKDTELYLELYNLREARVAPGTERAGETTLGLGGRAPLVKGHWLRLIAMGGHGLVSATPQNGQPTWIAYVGLQFLSDKRRRHGDE